MVRVFTGHAPNAAPSNRQGELQTVPVHDDLFTECSGIRARQIEPNLSDVLLLPWLVDVDNRPNDEA